MRHHPPRGRRTARTLTVVLSVLGAWLFAGLAPASPASADAPPSVIFIGDSVTAGFGYLGAQENPKNAVGPVNSEFLNAWAIGDSSLSSCNPPSVGFPDDRCTNNNVDGAPWAAGPWKPGAGAPTVAYSYQIAASQDPAASAPVENWAITGSTPQMWDTGGPFNTQLQKIRNTHVVMTLGANPILASFLQIKIVGYPGTNGACADSTQWYQWFSGWWANPPSVVADCADQQWAANNQTQHLESVYKTLLTNGNKVLVVGYHRTCPWSFGNWQPEGNIVNGPASGNSCTSQTQQVKACPNCQKQGTTSQWEQALAAQNEMNAKIRAAVAEVQAWADEQPGMSSANLQYTIPDASQWSNHQAWSSSSWVFKNDTWIHPSQAGHAQFAKTVTSAMCSGFGQWCGTQPAWTSTPAVQGGAVQQALKGSVLQKMENRSIEDLPSITKQGNPVHWQTRTPRLCKVFAGDLVSRNRDGACKLTARAFRSGSELPLQEKHRVRVR